jgi:hypothetical protein
MEAALFALPGHRADYRGLKDELAPYEANHKGTARFLLSQLVPVKLIHRIAKLRAKQVAERERANAGASKERSNQARGSLYGQSSHAIRQPKTGMQETFSDVSSNRDCR